MPKQFRFDIRRARQEAASAIGQGPTEAKTATAK